MEGPNPAAKEMFNKDVHDTFSRIAHRVQEIQANEAAQAEQEREEGLARLRAATQEDGSLALPIGPDGEGSERAEVFASFPKSFQEAILLQDVDKINEYLMTLSKDEAEIVVKKADAVGLLTLEVEEDN